MQNTQSSEYEELKYRTDGTKADPGEYKQLKGLVEKTTWDR